MEMINRKLKFKAYKELQKAVIFNYDEVPLWYYKKP